jgi:polysaccharide export outer membrane protein
MKYDTGRKLFLACSFLLGILFYISPSLANESPPDSVKEYVIGPEDVIDIQVWGNDDMHRVVEVSREGTFTFPFIDTVRAAGLPVAELENLIRQRLSEGYFTNPQVTVTVSKYRSQKVIVLGEVIKPGSYLIKGRTHILEIISEAGGLTEQAGRIVAIMRNGFPQAASPVGQALRESTSFSLDLDQLANGVGNDNSFVEDRDSIYVAKAGRVFITGEVNRPGEYKWDKGLTVNQAISLAGGPTKRGAIGRTKITRTENGTESQFKPKLSDQVIPDDIIDVPQSYF